ncbi:MAG TPA: periplasmic heavy metal sensor [Candidatus Aquilonibacter sp.]|nr:periplasmic heavy metal sensor [Candidatus Aquilonibacter sp.]
MRIGSKAAFAVLALALACTPVLAQGDPQDPPAQQQGGGRDFAMRGPMGPMRPGDGRDGFGRGGWGGTRGGVGRGRFGRDDGRRGMDGSDGGRRGFGLTRALHDPAVRQQAGITDEQFAKIRQQESDFRKTEIRDRADLQVKRIDLRDLLSADKPDRAAIDSKLQEISTAQLALQKSAVDYRLDMHDAITPAQRDKLRQALRDRWQQRGGPGRGGPQGMARRGQRGGRGGAGNGAAPQSNPQAAPAAPRNN